LGRSGAPAAADMNTKVGTFSCVASRARATTAQRDLCQSKLRNLGQ
jgi:hypothetical protein